MEKKYADILNRKKIFTVGGNKAVYFLNDEEPYKTTPAHPVVCDGLNVLNGPEDYEDDFSRLYVVLKDGEIINFADFLSDGGVYNENFSETDMENLLDKICEETTPPSAIRSDAC